MNAWSVTLIEQSAGAFRATATRDTGNKVEHSGGEEVLSRVLHDAFQMEVSLGASPGAAVFIITQAAKPGWSSYYHEQHFGSWSIHSPDGSTRIDYDGKEFFLMIQKGPKESPALIWQGRIASVVPFRIDYFNAIQRST